MTHRTAFLLTAFALPLMLGSGAQAKEGQSSSTATKSSSSSSNSTSSSGNQSSTSQNSSSSFSSHHRFRFSQDDAREALRKGKVMPLTAILEIVAKRQPGTVIAVDLEPRHTGLIYEIDVITEDGRRRELRLDARSGEILAVEDE
ncbi:MAG TPA: PepSY domain-containing protein [Rhizomicrobium sp.]|nr:PepSY domain-containing protein [Rhizomicrobium sp.]